MKMMPLFEGIKTQATRTLLRLGVLLPGLFLATVAQAQPNAFTYTTNANNTLNVSGYTGTGGAVIIPESVGGMPVVGIGDYAFATGRQIYRYSPTSVIIPGSVTNIGIQVFSGCNSLTNIEVEAQNPQYSSEAGVLFSKDKTTLIQYPGGMNGGYVIPSGVVSVGDGAFQYCANLTSVTMSDSVINLGADVFSGCKSLTNVTFSDGVVNIGSQAFYYCAALANVTLPGSVTNISIRAFSLSGLTSIIIPSSVTGIDVLAFSSCSSLTNIVVEAQNPQYSSEAGALLDKNQTTFILCPGGIGGSYAIPASVTNIGNLAFAWCGSLTSITIPSSVTSIGSQAFFVCPNLTSVTIPDNVTNIGDYAFSYSGLISVTVPGGVTEISSYAFFSCNSLTNVTILDGVTSINDSAFHACRSLTSVTLPNSITSIGMQAFCDCSIANITLPDNVTNIGSYAFSGSGLTSVIIPGSVIRIGGEAFWGCGNLTSVDILNGVTCIGDATFAYCSALTNVIISGSVTNIGTSTFWGCSCLTCVYFQGNAPTPSNDTNVFGLTPAIAYYLPGTTGWGPTFDGIPTAALFSPEPPVIQGNQATLNWLAMPGKACRVEYRADLTAGDWTVVTNLTATQLNMSVALPVTGRQGFYRIGMEP